MKRFYLLSITLLTLLFIGNGLYAQEFGSETTMTKQEARKAARAAHKKAMAAQSHAQFEQAVQCLKDGNFVIEADQLLFHSPSSSYITGNRARVCRASRRRSFVF